MFIITIQSTFEEVIESVKSGSVASESFWIARRDANKDELQYFDILVSLDANKEVFFEGKAENGEKVEFVTLSSDIYHVTVLSAQKSETYVLRAPKTKKSNCRTRNISLSEMNPINRNLFLGSLNGGICIYETIKNEEVGIISDAHYLSVSKLLLLPSGKVLMSIGDDFTIKLWDLSTDETPTVSTRSFMKQSKEITGVAIIGRGRNFASGSKDGTVNVWECSSGRVVTTFCRISNRSDPVNCLTITTSNNEPIENEFRASLLFECHQKVVFVGYELGLIQQYSIARNCATGIKLEHSAAVTSIASVETYIIAGYADGRVVVWDWLLEKKHFLVLNPNFPVAHISVKKSPGPKSVHFQLSNGPETLLDVDFNTESKEFDFTFLVGFKEMFTVLLIRECVSTGEEVAIF